MKSLLLLIFSICSLGLSAQQIDTIYSEVGNVVSKKVNLTINQVNGDKLTQVKETMTYDKALKKIEQLQIDTTSFTQYLIQLKNTEDQIAIERRRIRLMRRDAVDLLERLKNLLPRLQ